MPMQRSRNVTMSVKSVMDREEVLLAKMALGLANLSKMVNSSSFISSSSGTASIISSASRMASSTTEDVEMRESAIAGGRIDLAAFHPFFEGFANPIEGFCEDGAVDVLENSLKASESRGIGDATPHGSRA